MHVDVARCGNRGATLGIVFLQYLWGGRDVSIGSVAEDVETCADRATCTISPCGCFQYRDVRMACYAAPCTETERDTSHAMDDGVDFPGWEMGSGQ